MLRHNVKYTVMLYAVYTCFMYCNAMISTRLLHLKHLSIHTSLFSVDYIMQHQCPLAAYQSVWLLFHRQLTSTIDQRVCVLKCDIMETFRTGVISGNVKL